MVTTIIGLVGALTVAWLVGRPSGPTDPDVAVGEPVAGDVDVPTAPAPGVGVDVEADGGIPMELLATCDGPDGPSGCVRWVQRAGQLPRPGAAGLVTVVGDRLVSLDAETGARRWTAGVAPPISPPVVVGDHTVLLEDATGVRAFDLSDGDVRWHRPDQHLSTTPPDGWDGDVVVLDDLAGTLTAVDRQTGDTTWTTSADPATGQPVAVAVLPSDHLLLARPGSTRVVQATSGSPVWSVDGSLIAVTDLHVVTLALDEEGRQLAVRRPDGTLLASTPLPADVDLREVAITGTRLVLRTSDDLRALYLTNLDEQWRRDDLPVRLVTSRPLAMAGTNGRVDATTGLAGVARRSTALVAWRTDGTAVVLDERTGTEIRSIGEPSDGLRISDGFLTGRRLWRVDTQSLEVYDYPSGDLDLRIEVRAPPTVVLTRPVVVATSGRFVRLDPVRDVPGGVEEPR